jgi:hypothetical protein
MKLSSFIPIFVMPKTLMFFLLLSPDVAVQGTKAFVTSHHHQVLKLSTKEPLIHHAAVTSIPRGGAGPISPELATKIYGGLCLVHGIHGKIQQLQLKGASQFDDVYISFTHVRSNLASSLRKVLWHPAAS